VDELREDNKRSLEASRDFEVRIDVGGKRESER
jgi:hypothetical protein